MTLLNIDMIAVDNSSSSQTNFRRNNFLVLVEGPTDDINWGSRENVYY